MKIIDVTSEVFEWERPGIWNGNHFYGPGKLHKVTIYKDAVSYTHLTLPTNREV